MSTNHNYNYNNTGQVQLTVSSTISEVISLGQKLLGAYTERQFYQVGFPGVYAIHTVRSIIEQVPYAEGLGLSVQRLAKGDGLLARWKLGHGGRSYAEPYLMHGSRGAYILILFGYLAQLAGESFAAETIIKVSSTALARQLTGGVLLNKEHCEEAQWLLDGWGRWQATDLSSTAAIELLQLDPTVIIEGRYLRSEHHAKALQKLVTTLCGPATYHVIDVEPSLEPFIKGLIKSRLPVRVVKVTDRIEVLNWCDSGHNLLLVNGHSTLCPPSGLYRNVWYKRFEHQPRQWQSDSRDAKQGTADALKTLQHIIYKSADEFCLEDKQEIEQFIKLTADGRIGYTNEDADGSVQISTAEPNMLLSQDDTTTYTVNLSQLERLSKLIHIVCGLENSLENLLKYNILLLLLRIGQHDLDHPPFCPACLLFKSSVPLDYIVHALEVGYESYAWVVHSLLFGGAKTEEIKYGAGFLTSTGSVLFGSWDNDPTTWDGCWICSTDQAKMVKDHDYVVELPPINTLINDCNPPMTNLPNNSKSLFREPNLLMESDFITTDFQKLACSLYIRVKIDDDIPHKFWWMGYLPMADFDIKRAPLFSPGYDDIATAWAAFKTEANGLYIEDSDIERWRWVIAHFLTSKGYKMVKKEYLHALPYKTFYLHTSGH